MLDPLPTRPLPSPAPSPASSVHRVLFGPEGLRAGWSLTLFALLLYGIGSLAATLLHRLLPAAESYAAGTAGSHLIAPGHMLLAEGASLLALALATLVMSRIERRPLRAYGLGATPRAVPQLLSGLLCGAALLALLVLALWQLHLLVFTGELLHGTAALRFALEWLLAFALVGLFEEAFFRGYLQFTLTRGLAGILRAGLDSPFARPLGFWLAALLCSFVFGFGHRSNPGESPIGLLSAGLIGLIFALSLWRTGSLWWAVGVHTAWDWAQSFLFGVADSGTLVQFHLLASHPHGQLLLSGGTTGPEGSLLILAITALMAAVVHFTLPHTGWPAPGARTLPD